MMIKGSVSKVNRNMGDGADEDLQLLRGGEQAVSDVHARYQEAVLRGNVFTIQAKSVTVTVTTDISPLPASTGRAGVAIYNPPSSGVSLVLWKVMLASVSGTPGGPAYLDVLDGAQCTVTNKTNAINNLTLQTGGHKAFAYSAAVPGNTLAARMFKPLGGPAAIALGAGNNSVEEMIDGAIVLQPGGLCALTWHAVGTTHIYSASLSWEEIPS